MNMSRLAPVDKLPLAVRKDIRDSWESRKGDLEEGLTALLGQPWTIEINALQLYAYAEEGYAKEQTGAMIYQYIESAHNRLISYLDKHGDAGKKEINNACTAHVLTLDVDLEHDFLYNGCAITSDGKLALLFRADRLAVNIYDCLEEEKLTKALNTAPTATASGMSYVARTSIETEWEREAEKINKTFSDIVQMDVALEPGFQQTYDVLKVAKAGDEHWETNLGNFTRFYFEALADSLKSQKFDVDEMMREALVEALEKKVIGFRIVEDEKMKALYNECVFEDGALYMQTTADRFGVNISDVANGLIDLL